MEQKTTFGNLRSLFSGVYHDAESARIASSIFIDRAAQYEVSVIVKTFKRNVKAGGEEIPVFVVVVKLADEKVMA